jgi:AcrR family transcriptional regulator
MIADAIGVTKAAVYHQYNTREQIILAVAEVVLAGLEAAVTAAEAERSRSRAREVLIARMIDLAVERRRMASVLQRDPVMLRFLEEHPPFRHVMERVNRLLMGAASDPRARVQAALLAGGIAGAVLHPLVLHLDDDSLRSQLRKQTRKLLPVRGAAGDPELAASCLSPRALRARLACHGAAPALPTTGATSRTRLQRGEPFD